jgi:hypothetical protein
LLVDTYKSIIPISYGSVCSLSNIVIFFDVEGYEQKYGLTLLMGKAASLAKAFSGKDSLPLIAEL